MLENYVSPTNKVVDLMAALQFPFANLPSGDTVIIATDTNMDPVIWQVIMGIVKQHDAEPVLMMYPPREYHQAEPPKPLLEGIKAAQWCVFLTTTALAHSDFIEACKEHNVGTLLMEEATVDILTSSGCQLTQKDWDQIVERSREIRKVWMEGGDVHVTSPAHKEHVGEVCAPDQKDQAGTCQKEPHDR